MANDNLRYDVFISYSHKDEDWVHQWLLPPLKAAGLRTCIDIEDFEVGAPSLTEMERAVIQSAKTLLVLTPEYLTSEWAEFENILVQTLDPAARRRRVLPLLLKDCERPLRIAALTYADFRTESRRETELERVVAAITGERTGPSPARETGSGLQPFPPQPDLFHPYPLQKHFTGRVGYRKRLTQWLAAADCPIFSLTAIGGTGKSALAWAWVQRDVLGRTLADAADDSPEDADACRLPEDSRPDGVLWWSFYERESAFSTFLDEAITYTSGGKVSPADIPSDYDKARNLIQLLQNRRFLLVLDGFERQLRAYTSLNAPYQGEVEEDERGDFRSCVHPHLARFLQDAASLNIQSRFLLTTRHFPRDLDGIAGCESTPLEDMDLDEAVAFFHAHGINGTRTEIEAACAPYRYHPLALRLLAGLILKDTQEPADIRAAKRYPVVPELKGKEQHHILQVAHGTLDGKTQVLLSQIAAFRSAMPYNAIAMLNSYETADEFDSALRDLIDRGLLLHDTADNRYDLHPVVRQYAYDRLADKEGTHTRLREYFTTIPDSDKIESLDDLAPTVELYHHTVRAGHYDEARDLLRDRLIPDPLYFRFGAYQTCIELLRPLFPNGEDKPPRLQSKAAQGWTLNELANSYNQFGHPRRAEPLFDIAVELAAQQGLRWNVGVGLANLANTQLLLGRLTDVEQNLRRSIDLCRDTGDEFLEAVAHKMLGQLLSYQAAYREAGTEFLTALAFFEQIDNKLNESIVWGCRAACCLLVGQPADAIKAASRARQLAAEAAKTRYAIEREIIAGGWVQGAALVALAVQDDVERSGRLAQAESHLTEALTRCRRINLVEFEPDILLAWAKWHHLKSDPAQARKNANDALSIADRCEYRLKQADCHNFLAALDQQEGDTESAIAHARTARERALCDGPPHCYRPALDQATCLLKSLNADPPCVC